MLRNLTISRVLFTFEVDLTRRLGNMHAGTDDIKSHPYFAGYAINCSQNDRVFSFLDRVYGSSPNTQGSIGRSITSKACCRRISPRSRGLVTPATSRSILKSLCGGMGRVWTPSAILLLDSKAPVKLCFLFVMPKIRSCS